MTTLDFELEIGPAVAGSYLVVADLQRSGRQQRLELTGQRLEIKDGVAFRQAVVGNGCLDREGY